MNLFKDGQADDVILSGELAQQNANDPAYTSVKEARTSLMNKQSFFLQLMAFLIFPILNKVFLYNFFIL
ncbi:hypothetical protein EfmGK961_05750 [Enterococcus faecium]|nr:hypothetical protein EfmGK961_05750 [Enterococcus faecium]